MVNHFLTNNIVRWHFAYNFVVAWYLYCVVATESINMHRHCEIVKDMRRPYLWLQLLIEGQVQCEAALWVQPGPGHGRCDHLPNC